jgi:hypothetical protein
MVTDKRVHLSKRDYAIIARALETANVASIGDMVCGKVAYRSDAKLTDRIGRLVRHFWGKANTSNIAD